jgi:hypothetical protein
MMRRDKDAKKSKKKTFIFVLEDASHALETTTSAGKVGNTNHLQEKVWQ